MLSLLSTWMYHFWVFSFQTAKNWGRGPILWTADLLGLKDHQRTRSIMDTLPSTTSENDLIWISQQRLSEERESDLHRTNESRPLRLCRWIIHRFRLDNEIGTGSPQSTVDPRDLDDKPITEAAQTADQPPYPDDEALWPSWSKDQVSENYGEKLANSIHTSTFSSVDKEDLPIDTTQVAKSARRAPEEMLYESIAFSIMGGNAVLLANVLCEKPDLIASGLFPFHLAASYLDGTRSCCSILLCLIDHIPYGSELRKLYINDLGHTAIDQLMITILKSHTSCAPGIVDQAFKKDFRFAGEEIDICGRWSAESPCIRTLLARGSPKIPSKWKHMFCHTSIHVICHCIDLLSFTFPFEVREKPSGLFVRRCSRCGLKLELYPFHALLMIAVHLSTSGRKGENLFGILACLLCLLNNKMDSWKTANISLEALLSDTETAECSHQELDPREFANELLKILLPIINEEIISGWKIIFHVLESAQIGDMKARPYSGEDDILIFERVHNDYRPFKCNRRCPSSESFRRSSILAPLWAAVKTEVLTYRRLNEDDPWISPYFDMKALSEDLENDGELRLALLQNSMMKPYCRCGCNREYEPLAWYRNI